MQLPFGSKLRNPAHSHCPILIGAIKICISRPLQNHPSHAELCLQPGEVLFLKVLPILQSLHLGPPLICQRRKHAHRAAILDCVGQPASLGQAPEADYKMIEELGFVITRREAVTE